MKRGLALFVSGAAVGLAVGFFSPCVLPVTWRLALGSVEGAVEALEHEDGRLLLTLSTENGVTLATFKEDVAEIDLLIDRGDLVTLAVRNYRPFLEDPVIARVKRAAAALPAAAVERPVVEGPAELEDEAETGGQLPALEEPDEPEAAPSENQGLDEGG